MKHFYDPHPLHPSVNWNTEIYLNSNSRRVTITCPICHSTRQLDSSKVATQIRKSQFTGNCQKDAAIARGTRLSGIPRIARTDYTNNLSLQHPCVDWTSIRHVEHSRRRVINITCPICHKITVRDAAEVASHILHDRFTGMCFKDRLIGSRRASTHDNPTPPHPQVDWNTCSIQLSGTHRIMHVQVTCPKCQLKRWSQAVGVRNLIYANKFTGLCPSCAGLDKGHEWVILGPGRKIHPLKGYVYVDRRAIPPEHMWLFKAMRKTQSTILEHRLNMAIYLGRPLDPNELIDHMDGVKTNNDPSNLRLYIRSKQMPGSCPGHGTYYHEWQIALARIQELENQLTQYAVQT